MPAPADLCGTSGTGELLSLVSPKSDSDEESAASLRGKLQIPRHASG